MYTAASADGYAGPPPWQWADLATSWTAEPVVLTLSALLGGWYLVAARRARRAGGRRQPTRTAAFLGGLALWIWTTCSGLGVYERILFTDRAVQVVLLLMLVPLLLALGAPVSLLLDTVSEPRRERMLGLLRSKPSKVLMFPAVSTALLLAPPWLLYLTPWYEKTLSSGLWNIGLHLSLVALGLAYFWPRLQIDPVGREYPHLIGLIITFAEVILDAALAMIVMWGGHLLGGHYYQALGRPWGPSLVQDQFWGGNALWILGDVVGLPFLCALLRRLVVQGRAETAAVDRELDAREALRRETVASGSDESDEQSTRPWWLDDPRLAHRYGGAE